MDEFIATASPRLKFPNRPRYDYVSDYIQSKDFMTSDKIFPEFDVVRMDDPKNCLALLGIKLQFTEKRLCQKRNNLASTRKDLDQQWKELADKEEALKKSFVHFDSFVKENEDKRERAEKSLNEDLKLLEQTRREIEKCNKDYLEIKSYKAEMDQKIKEYGVYGSYLNKVVAASEEFVSCQELINRYLCLLGAKNYLATLQENNLRALESARSDMMKLIEEKNFILMGLNNQVASLQSRFENAKIRSLECEHLVLQIKNNAVIKLNEIEEVKSTVWNMYTNMVSSKTQPLINKDDVEEQMLFVKRTLTETVKVNQILRKRRGSTSIDKTRSSNPK